ncbi:unnamed protein product [Rhodiola kirilowii]
MTLNRSEKKAFHDLQTAYIIVFMYDDRICSSDVFKEGELEAEGKVPHPAQECPGFDKSL